MFIDRYLASWVYYLITGRGLQSIVISEVGTGDFAHISTLFPPDWKYRFMGKKDLLIAFILTSDSHQKNGLAKYAIQELLRRSILEDGYIWYMTRSGNGPSERIAKKSGFTCVGQVHRKLRLGSAKFGTFDSIVA